MICWGISGNKLYEFILFSSTGEVYYQYMYYCLDATMAVSIMVVLWKIEVVHENKELKNDSILVVFKKILSPIWALLMLQLFVFGTLYSMVQYYIIFAQTELGASSKLIG